MASIYKTLAILLALMPLTLFGQMDTLLFEDFQDQSLEPGVDIFPEGSNTNWVNYDEDGLEDANDRGQDWFLDVDQIQASQDSIAAADSNFVYMSSSWLSGFLDGNRNWLITPPIQIVDDQATFHWKSAPFQGPRYMDGYSVLVSTGENYDIDFTDTLFRAAQMGLPLPNGNSDAEINAFNVDSFVFAPADAYVHADRYTLEDYFILADSADTFYTGGLEPHSVSLSAYAGETIYIAILHDSDDDNLIYVDDILVMGTNPSSSVDGPVANDIRLVTYPNPVTNYVNVLFRVDEPAMVSLELIDMNGQRVLAKRTQERLIGEQSLRLNLSSLPAGNYNAVLNIDGQNYVRQLVKQ
jgi:hypothetical protein